MVLSTPLRMLLAGACALTTVVGCASEDPPVRSPTPFARADDLSTTRVHGGDNGLEIVLWSAPCTAEAASAAIIEAGRGGTLPPETLERLRRNGFVVAEVPTDQLPLVLAALGGTLSDIRNWHGQVPEWRELARTTLGPGAAIYTGERVQPVAGSLRLSMRGWTVPMEDGGLFWLEMIPHAVARESSVANAMASRDRVRGEAFPDAGLSVVLDRGWSLLLCPDAPAPVAQSSTGPDVEPPGTLGSLLLPATELPALPGAPPQLRTPVYVFVARLPGTLVPQTMPDAGGGS